MKLLDRLIGVPQLGLVEGLGVFLVQGLGCCSVSGGEVGSHESGYEIAAQGDGLEEAAELIDGFPVSVDV